MLNPKRQFIDKPRQTREERPVRERLKDYKEVYAPATDELIKTQADRCMDCGVPFCQAAGCPLANVIPEFNDCVSRGRFQAACDLLHASCNFPEFTGRLCPALCEGSCTLGVGFEPVSIRELEWEVVERGWRMGYIVPKPPQKRTGKKVAVIGSGPSGLVVAQMVNWAGHTVTVFEADDKIGGFLRYGVPDFKLEKWVIDRRVKLLQEEGIHFDTGVHVGEDISAHYLRSKFDAICLCSGARAPRDLPIPGRGLHGIHFAAEYLKQSNRRQAGESVAPEELIDAKDKTVVVLGGGDTGADCIGTANRQGAAKVHQYELLPQPPEGRAQDNPWPEFPRILKTTSSHEEGCERRWNINTTSFNRGEHGKGGGNGGGGGNGRLVSLTAVEVDWIKDDAGRWTMMGKTSTRFTQPCELVLLALGFVHPIHGKLLAELGIGYDERGNVKADPSGMTSVEGVFAAGDVTAGATLIVRAMTAGRRVSAAIKQYLGGR